MMDGNERKQPYDFNEQQKLAGNLLRAGLFGEHTNVVFSAQARLTSVVERAIAAWLQRRRDAIADTQRLIERLREGQSPTDAWTAQQEWLAAEVKRLQDDAIGLQSAATEIFSDTVQQAASDELVVPAAARDAKPGKARVNAVAELAG